MRTFIDNLHYFIKKNIEKNFFREKINYQINIFIYYSKDFFKVVFQNFIFLEDY
jgi:hypothetical protein